MQVVYKKFIKFHMRGGNFITVPFEKAEEIMASDSQVILIDDMDGKWSGLSLNKADITMTERDREAESDYRKNNTLRLEAPPEKKLTQKQMDKIEEKKKEISESFKIK